MRWEMRGKYFERFFNTAYLSVVTKYSNPTLRQTNQSKKNLFEYFKGIVYDSMKRRTIVFKEEHKIDGAGLLRGN